MTDRFDYSAHEWEEIDRLARLALDVPGIQTLARATRREDFDGVDVHFTVNQRCDLQVRLRRDRPGGAEDEDVTFRTTELPMIQRGTYAPLVLFVWVANGRAIAGKLVDPYALNGSKAIWPLQNERARPRRSQRNPDGSTSWWFAVSIAECWTAKALLRMGNRSAFVPAICHGDDFTQAIVDQSHRVHDVSHGGPSDEPPARDRFDPFDLEDACDADD